MWWRAEAGGISVRVKVQPRARRPGLHGLVPSGDGPRLKVAVTEAPEDGRANRAVCASLARALGIAPSAVQVALGAAAREKTLAVAGDPADLAARIRMIPATTPEIPT